MSPIRKSTIISDEVSGLHTFLGGQNVVTQMCFLQSYTTAVVHRIVGTSTESAVVVGDGYAKDAVVKWSPRRNEHSGRMGWRDIHILYHNIGPTRKHDCMYK